MEERNTLKVKDAVTKGFFVEVVENDEVDEVDEKPVVEIKS